MLDRMLEILRKPHRVNYKLDKTRVNSGRLSKIFGNLPMQVELFWDETVVPEGQLSTQVPLERKDPGKQAVHCF